MPIGKCRQSGCFSGDAIIVTGTMCGDVAVDASELMVIAGDAGGMQLCRVPGGTGIG